MQSLSHTNKILWEQIYTFMVTYSFPHSWFKMFNPEYTNVELLSATQDFLGKYTCNTLNVTYYKESCMLLLPTTTL